MGTHDGSGAGCALTTHFLASASTVSTVKASLRSTRSINAARVPPATFQSVTSPLGGMPGSSRIRTDAATEISVRATVDRVGAPGTVVIGQDDGMLAVKGS